MKTTLTCLGILIAAIILGKHQGTRLAELKQQHPSEVALRTKSHSREAIAQKPVYRSKYQRTTHHAVAMDVFQTLIECMAGRTSTSVGQLASMTDLNKEALKAVLQLDQSGLEELITMISQSKDPALTRNLATKYEQVSLCIIAMADQDPGHALDYVLNAKSEMNPKVFKEWGTRQWLEYVLIRLGDRDPQRALDELVTITNDSAETMQEDQVRTILGKLARRDPVLVLDAIDHLPGMKGPQIYQTLTYSQETDDERTALFLAARDRLRSKPEEQKLALKSVCDRFGNAQNSMAESRKWLEGLGMTDAEKNLALDPLCRVLADSYSTGLLDNARWFAKFMPPSDERDSLIWERIAPVFDHDPAQMVSFCGELGIDPQEIMHRERDAN